MSVVLASNGAAAIATRQLNLCRIVMHVQLLPNFVGNARVFTLHIYSTEGSFYFNEHLLHMGRSHAIIRGIVSL